MQGFYVQPLHVCYLFDYNTHSYKRSDTMRYYIADCHFFHASLNTKMDKRGFESVERNELNI